MSKQKNIVKSAKSSVTLLVIAIIAIGWVLTFVGLTSHEEEDAQRALHAQAQELLEDKLYVRAAAKYEEALTYNTSLNNKLEEKLLDVYRDGEMIEEYYSLITKRIDADRASEEEYLTISKGYIDANSENKAIALLDKGVSVYPENEEMKDLFESIRYRVSESTTNFSTVKMPSTGKTTMIPAFNGEKWGFINNRGRLAMEFRFEDITAFDGSYAVAKLDGEYILIDGNGYRNAVDKNGLDAVECFNGKRIVGVKDGKYKLYSNTFKEKNDEEYDGIILSENGLTFVKKNDKWALLDAEYKNITDYVFTDVKTACTGLAFNSGYAVVADANGYFMIGEDGVECFSARFPDAKGMEGGLVAVANGEGKWGFINQKGEEKVPFEYEDACSFSSNLGAVKIGDAWGYINRYNTLVIKAKYAQANAFIADQAIVVDSLDNVLILSLKYYSYIKK